MQTLNYSTGWIWLFVILAIWDTAWKAFALWRAAKNDSIPWFVLILILNTIGVLPIFYLFVFGKKK